ncbi:metabolite traffic protein EboE [Streptomyces sp. MNU76]|uniref:metabolite traffic protein EboE n=1 Tax=Streptomyces sp. MNU76 TaxID=2560026 RepID=UPI001E42617D|nr:metabolite traffic protein EboE [Streptomyces sp. MNU76]MCC9705713.1 metabolite traffic protein EboE [Streptomyces sp. MNU76]
MRFRHPDGSTVHLAYCTNVHPAETLDGVLAQLRDHCEPVRRRLGRDRLGIGLWLARDAAAALVTDPAALRGLRTELDRRGLEVVTLNGFPYQGFGAEEVKYRVYRPDWADPERLDHTTSLARVLAQLLPDDVTDGTVSTLPLAWRTAYDDTRAARSRTALRTLAERLDVVAELTGRSIRIGLEPEPGCTVETTADAIGPLTDIGHERIGICVDTCHLATSFEDPHTALDALTRARVPIVKSQLSAAVHAEHPHLPEVREALAAFDEPRFLHQTRTSTARRPAARRPRRGPHGRRAARRLPWRAHFHVRCAAPPRPSPPPSRSSRPHWPTWSAAPTRSPAIWRSRPTPGRPCPELRPSTRPTGRRHRRRTRLSTRPVDGPRPQGLP